MREQTLEQKTEEYCSKVRESLIAIESVIASNDYPADAKKRLIKSHISDIGVLYYNF